MIILIAGLLIGASFILLNCFIWEDNEKYRITYGVFSGICFVMALISLLCYAPLEESKYNSCVRNYARSIEGANVKDAHEACKDLINKTLIKNI